MNRLSASDHKQWSCCFSLFSWLLDWPQVRKRVWFGLIFFSISPKTSVSVFILFSKVITVKSKAYLCVWRKHTSYFQHNSLFSLSKCTVAVVGSHAPGALLVQRLYVCSWLVPSWYQWTPALQSEPELNWYSKTRSYCSVLHETGYRSPLNDFQRSEGRELVPTAWNSARVLLLPGQNLEDCATRCSQSLDCRYPSFKWTLKA